MKYQKTLNLVSLRVDLNNLVSQVAPDSIFVQKLVNRCVYGSVPEKNRTKYFLSMIETYSYSKPNALTPDKQLMFLDLSDWQLEHIVPQNPQSGGFSFSEPEVDQIGNLCLLPPDWNQFLSNHDYQQKRSIVASEIAKGHNLLVQDSNKIFTDPALANGPWDQHQHGLRVSDLTVRACQIFTI
jgi:hypothetical protein